MSRRVVVACIASGLLVVGSLALAQTAGTGAREADAPMTNLQVWPKDTPRSAVIQTMNAFNDSLGVECNYCHVQEGGRFDFASDAKREKIVARQMILLRDSINVMMAAMVGKPAGAGPTAGDGQPGAPVRVLCRSCHRGLPVPRTIGDVVNEAARAGGGAAGLARFRELRAQYYGGQQYDFTENSLLTIAQGALNGKRLDEAITYLQANLEYFPRSARTYQAMAQARSAKGDNQGAIRDLERALELDPANAQIRSQLQQLRSSR